MEREEGGKGGKSGVSFNTTALVSPFPLSTSVAEAVRGRGRGEKTGWVLC